MIGAVLVGACIAGAVLCRRRAPAVSLGLAGGLLAGVFGFFVSSADGLKLVPADVVLWASCGLGALGLIGVLVLPGRPAAAPLRHAAVAVVLAAPFVAAAVGYLLVKGLPPLHHARRGVLLLRLRPARRLGLRGRVRDRTRPALSAR